MTRTELNIGFIEFYPNNEISRTHPYTLASRSKQPHKPKLAKEMATPTLTEKKMKKARAYNKTYTQCPSGHCA
ncbi:MAG: hypothetical protein WC319_11830 [Candidatus Paceibacterota bacterium]|jgi:hypothetical protein